MPVQTEDKLSTSTSVPAANEVIPYLPEESASTGFAKLPTEPEAAAIVAELTLEQKVALLEEMIGKPLNIEQHQLGLQEKAITEAVLAECSAQVDNPKTRIARAVRLGENLRSFVGLHNPIAEKQHEVQAEIVKYFEEEAPIVEQRLNAGEKFSDIANDITILRRAQERYEFDFSDVENQQDLLPKYQQLVDFYRGARNYSGVSAVTHAVLAEELDAEIAKIPEHRNVELLAEAASKVDGRLNLAAQELEEFIPEQRAILRDSLIEETVYQLQVEEAARTTFDPNTLSGVKREIWDSYNDSLDPKGEWLNIKDSNVEMIIDEMIINAPLIIASGGTASLVRAGVTGGARALIGRVAVAEAIAGGASFTTQQLAKEGSLAIARFTGENVLKRGGVRVATGTAGLFVEGAAFETTHLGIQGEWIGNMPDWGQRILWTSATLGAFHGAGRVGEQAFGKTILEEGVAKISPTKLGEIVGKIENPAVQEVAKQLIVKGHLEAATMLSVGALQNGAYGGSTKEFFENFGDEMLHAYVAVGALKTGHALAGKLIEGAEGVAEATKLNVAPKREAFREAREAAATEAAAKTEQRQEQAAERAAEKAKPGENPEVVAAEAAANVKPTAPKFPAKEVFDTARGKGLKARERYFSEVEAEILKVAEPAQRASDLLDLAIVKLRLEHSASNTLKNAKDSVPTEANAESMQLLVDISKVERESARQESRRDSTPLEQHPTNISAKDSLRRASEIAGEILATEGKVSQRVVSEIADLQIRRGDLEGAELTVKHISKPEQRFALHLRLAEERNKVGENPNPQIMEAMSIAENMLRENKIPEAAKMLPEIVESCARTGVDYSEILQITRAVVDAPTMPDGKRPQALLRLAQTESAIGLDCAKTLSRALEATKDIRNDVSRYRALTDIGEVSMGLGKENDAFLQAKYLAEKLDNKYLQTIAELGQETAERVKSDPNFEPNEISRAHYTKTKDALLSDAVKLELAGSDVSAAKGLGFMIRNGDSRSAAFYDIAGVEISLGKFKDAEKTIQNIKVPELSKLAKDELRDAKGEPPKPEKEKPEVEKPVEEMGKTERQEHEIKLESSRVEQVVERFKAAGADTSAQRAAVKEIYRSNYRDVRLEGMKKLADVLLGQEEVPTKQLNDLIFKDVDPAFRFEIAQYIANARPDAYAFDMAAGQAMQISVPSLAAENLLMLSRSMADNQIPNSTVNEFVKVQLGKIRENSPELVSLWCDLARAEQLGGNDYLPAMRQADAISEGLTIPAQKMRARGDVARAWASLGL
jgi:hypothetical protein